MKLYKLIIFDADGTLTPQRSSATGPAIFELLPGVAAKCAVLRAQGVKMAIASNQSVQRKKNEIYGQLWWTAGKLGILPYNIVYSCFPARQKPSPAMLLGIMSWHAVSSEFVLFVGDQETDRQAAERAGVDFEWASVFFAQTAKSVV